MTKTLCQTVGDNHRIGDTIREETVDVKIMETEVKVEIGAEIE